MPQPVPDAPTTAAVTGPRALPGLDVARLDTWLRCTHPDLATDEPLRAHLVDSLPLGASGKVLKRELVAQYSAAAEPVAR